MPKVQISDFSNSLYHILMRKCFICTVDDGNPKVRISGILEIVWLLNRSDFGICPKTEPFRLDFERLVDRLDHPNVRISNVYSITERSNEPNGPNVRNPNV